MPSTQNPAIALYFTKNKYKIPYNGLFYSTKFDSHYVSDLIYYSSHLSFYWPCFVFAQTRILLFQNFCTCVSSAWNVLSTDIFMYPIGLCSDIAFNCHLTSPWELKWQSTHISPSTQFIFLALFYSIGTISIRLFIAYLSMSRI